MKIGMTKEELIPFDEGELLNFVEDQYYHLDPTVFKFARVHAVFSGD